MNTVTLQILSPQIIGLLYELQKNNMVKVVNFEYQPGTKSVRLSEKYRGVINREKGKELLNHIDTIRNEWNDTF